jgi:hypothetical protein
LPLRNPLLQHRRRQKITRFDTLIFEFRKRHRPTIRVHTATHDFSYFTHNLPQTLTLRAR